MRIDAYTHFFPKKFFDKLNEVAGDYKDMGKRVRSLPALYDVDVRKKIVDSHKDYQQILSYPQPTIESFAKNPADIDEFCRIINDGFAELCAKEKDHFPGWVGARFARRARCRRGRSGARGEKLGALGVQIYTNVKGKPIDRPEYLPFWKKMNELGAPVWLHPARGAETPDYVAEKKSLYEIWWTFGWSYETATRHDAAGVLQDHGQPSEPEDHHPPFRRHRADARRPHRAGQRRDGFAHHGRGLRHAAQEPEEAPARLFQAGFLGRHRGVHRGAGDQMRAWNSSRATRSCSPPIARSIRKAARCIRARPCEFLKSSSFDKADQRQDLLQESRGGHRTETGEALTCHRERRNAELGPFFHSLSATPCSHS